MYSNKELCEKWNNNIPASELRLCNLATDSQEITELYNHFSFLPLHEAIFDDESLYLASVTGILYTLGDGDYEEVYVTESSRPYSLDAIYHPLDYYKE